MNTLVGPSVVTGEPLCLNNDTPGHTLVQGATGTGKTLGFTLGQIDQQLRAGKRRIQVYSFKQDDPFALLCERLGKKRGARTKLFSTNPRLRTHIYNPIDQKHIKKLGAAERSQLFSLMLGLLYGTEFSRGFFGGMNNEFVRRLFEVREWESLLMMRNWFSDPKARITMKMSDRMWENSSHAPTTIGQMADIWAASATKDDVPKGVWDARIEHEDECTTPGLTIFMSSSFVQANSGEAILRAALASHMAALDVTPNRIPHSIYIEEGQKALTPAIATIFEQARYRGASITFSCQSLAQLETPERSYVDTLLTNTGSKVFFGPYSDKHSQETMERIGGEVTRIFRGWSPTGETGREDLVPRFGKEELGQIANTPNHAIVVQRPGAGLAQYMHPAVVRVLFPVSREEYEETLRDPWPGDPAETIIPAELWKDGPPSGSPKPLPEEEKPKPEERAAHPAVAGLVKTQPVVSSPGEKDAKQTRSPAPPKKKADKKKRTK